MSDDDRQAIINALGDGQWWFTSADLATMTNRPVGRLHPALIALERDGVITARWLVWETNRHRIYKLTGETTR